jgi:hypothetical protein
MKARTMLALLLLVHLLAHPAMHAFVSWDAAPSEQTAVSAGGQDESRVRPEGSICYVCRTAHALYAPAATDAISLAEAAQAIWVAPAAEVTLVWHSSLTARAPPVS